MFRAISGRFEMAISGGFGCVRNLGGPEVVLADFGALRSGHFRGCRKRPFLAGAPACFWPHSGPSRSVRFGRFRGGRFNAFWDARNGRSRSAVFGQSRSVRFGRFGVGFFARSGTPGTGVSVCPFPGLLERPKRASSDGRFRAFWSARFGHSRTLPFGASWRSFRAPSRPSSQPIGDGRFGCLLGRDFHASSRVSRTPFLGGR